VTDSEKSDAIARAEQYRQWRTDESVKGQMDNGMSNGASLETICLCWLLTWSWRLSSGQQRDICKLDYGLLS
jgi:hypothetical protein